jgi:outer membrane protein OmpA-like peptidoglycan-associated protein
LLGTAIHDEMNARAGVGYRFGGHDGHGDLGQGPFEVDLTIAGATAPKELFSRRTQDAGAVSLTFQYDLPVPLTLFAAGGVGVFPAYGVPDFNLLAGVRLHPWKATPAASPVVDLDPDHDGVIAPHDRCPERAEDKDGFEDEDGCPDPDNDGDGTPDVNDACPLEKGVAENKGCPDKDSDGDGIADRRDKCPGEAEDKDGFEDDDGCPEPDNDKDGLADAADACPNEPGTADTKGCPDPDRDGDGVPDRVDNCPDEAGSKENQGCQSKQLARITTSGIEILETVYFKVDRDIIQPKSFKLLMNVAEVIRNHPEAGVIRVEGHTDDRGKAAHNQDLSQRRAESVVAYLVKAGVPRDRLIAKGFGAAQPLANNRTAEGRAQNRRVVFTRSE